MAILQRSFTYHGRIKVSTSDLRLAREGRKRCTIRLGKVGVASDTIALTDGKESLQVRITSIDNARLFKDLTDQDAILEGFTSKTELEDDLKHYYGGIDPLQPITVIHFEISKAIC